MVTGTRLAMAYFACLTSLVLVDLLLIIGSVSATGNRTWNGVSFDRPNLPSVSLLYLIYTSGLVFFGVWPAMATRQIWLSLPGGLAYGAIGSIGFALTSLKLREAPRGREILMRGMLAALAALIGVVAAEWMPN